MPYEKHALRIPDMRVSRYVLIKFSVDEADCCTKVGIKEHRYELSAIFSIGDILYDILFASKINMPEGNEL